MPKVPEYNRQTTAVQVLPNARANVSGATPEAFGAMGDVRSQVQSDTTKNLGIVTQIRDRADDAAVKEAYIAAQNYRNDLIWNQKDGLQTRQGKSAIGSLNYYGDKYQEKISEIGKGLSNDRQRQMFQQLERRVRQGLVDTVNRHEFAETQKYQVEINQSGINAAVETASNYWQDPSGNEYNTALEDVEIFVRSQAEIQGHGESWVQDNIQKIKSSVHKNTIDRMLTNDMDSNAVDFFESVKNLMTPDDQAIAEKAIDTAIFRRESQELSDKIVSESTSLSQVYASAKEIDDPKLRDEVTRRAVSDYKAIKESREYDLKQMFDEDAKKVFESGNIDSISEMRWNSYPVDYRQDFIKLAKGPPAETKWERYYYLKNMAERPELRKKFASHDLMRERVYLADAEFKELVNAQMKLNSGDSEINKLLDTDRTYSQIVNDTLDEIGIEKDSQNGILFKNEMQRNVTILQNEKGRELTDDEVLSLANTLTTKVDIVGAIRNRPIFTLNAGDEIDLSDIEIPSFERRLIENELARRGLDPKDEEIVKEMYIRKLRGLGYVPQ